MHTKHREFGAPPKWEGGGKGTGGKYLGHGDLEAGLLGMSAPAIIILRLVTGLRTYKAETGDD